MKTFRLIGAGLFAVLLGFAFTGCSSDDDKGGGSTEKPETEKQITGQLSSGTDNSISYDDCKIICSGGESDIENGAFATNTYVNDNVQTFVVADESDNVYLLSRTPVVGENELTIDAHTTTMALVTMHPLFSGTKAEEYNDIVNFVTSSSKFDALHAEVEKSIAEKRDIFDLTNEGLLIALSDLMEDLTSEVDVEEDDYAGGLDDIVNASTRAIYNDPKVYPFYADITGNILTLRNTGLTPSYYGSVMEPDGSETPFSVSARDDYGFFLDLWLNRDAYFYGEKCQYRFSKQGEYYFNLSRLHPSATSDFFLRMTNSLLSIVGLDVEQSIRAEISNTISRAIINAGYGVYENTIEPMAYIEIAWDGFMSWVDDGGYKYLKREALQALAKSFAKSFDFYGKIKGGFNALMRMTYGINAPTDVNFCLCYYNNVVSTCSEVILHKVSGDAQTGYANQKLLLPLVVGVETLEEGENSYHRIKFEVVSGGGSVASELVSADYNNQASTYWTLGTEGEQTVKVTAVDVITDKEISTPVYFTATLDKADVTIRLDWNKHSGNTDIDLHVIDPYGEEIYYSHMYSESGGYLDRDDRVGPGPEHVRWSNAPAGTYKIFVRYYPNGDPDRSITSYKVSVTANGVKYAPKTGSIAYDTKVAVGQFTIGGSSAATRSASSGILDETDYIDSPSFYEKKQP